MCVCFTFQYDEKYSGKIEFYTEQQSVILINIIFCITNKRHLISLFVQFMYEICSSNVCIKGIEILNTVGYVFVIIIIAKNFVVRQLD